MATRKNSSRKAPAKKAPARKAPARKAAPKLPKHVEFTITLSVPSAKFQKILEEALYENGYKPFKLQKYQFEDIVLNYLATKVSEEAENSIEMSAMGYGDLFYGAIYGWIENQVDLEQDTYDED